MMDVVKSVGLIKVYHSKGNVEALKGINLSIRKGELFTLLGPNGAGKTTFLRIISTQLLPTKGEGNFTPWEYSYYFSLLRDMTRQEAKDSAEKALKSVELWDLRNRPCATLSGGEKKRAIIASALASNADVLMLDEPTSGLDAVARRNVWAVLRDLVEQDRTILLTTHIMEEAEMISDRLAIIHKGEVVAEGTPNQIKRLTKERFRVVVEGNLRKLGLLENNNHIVKFGRKHIIYVKNEDEALELVRKALKEGLKAETSPVTLEDVFVKLAGGKMN